MFVDKIDSYFGQLFFRMQEPYIGWQSEDYWRRQAMRRGPPSAAGRGGGNAPLGVLIPPDGNYEPKGGGWGRGRGPEPIRGPPVPDPLSRPPPASTPSAEAEERRYEEDMKKSHLEILEELGQSLAADITPHLVEVEGKVVELTGSATAQYETWRGLLRQIFAEETGLRPTSASR